MGDFEATTTVDAAADALYAYLSDVGNLPRYFARMTSAEPSGEGGEVHTAAELPGGQHVEGDAWFRADAGTRHIEWGAEGPNTYHGSLEIESAGPGATVRVRLHTTRVPDGDTGVQQGLDDTLATIKDLVEKQHVTG
ncbi:SRPBCC family protein [Amycolatopsis sp. NPDC088138]|uniref:SRPBCC family protein n=1 Tax=Amycolatopsis sp. NPDC088138 TaxID=3363938 RepID=UPI00380301C3